MNKAVTSAPAKNGAATSTVNLLSSLDLASSIVRGDWTLEGTALRVGSASNKSRAKLRLVPPPGEGAGSYDLTVTFTPTGDRRVIALILSSHGRQFLFGMFNNQCGFASVHGKNALQNETTRPKGVTAGTKYTATVKVRENQISAAIDGEEVTTYTPAPDFTDLDLGSAWNLGQGNTKEKLIGLAVECPVLIEAISFTPVGGGGSASPSPKAQQQQVAATPPVSPAAAAFKDLATVLSSPYSTESSAAATQPAAMTPHALDPARLQPLAAASQPAVSDVAAAVLQPLPAGDAAARDALFRAEQSAASAPAASPPDPLLEPRAADTSTRAIDRSEFDAEQARLAAWKKLIERTKDLYPNAKPQSDLVKLQLDAAAKGKPPSFLATLGGSEALTNVTLGVETVHAVTAPAPTAVRYYFIPRWSPGQKIYLPTDVVPNVSSPALLDAQGPLPANGVVEARSQLWSDTLQQQSQSATFEANAQPFARAQVEEAYRLVDEALRRSAPVSRPAGSPAPPQPAAARTTALVGGPIVPTRVDHDDNSADFARAKAIAQRAATLLTAGSPLAEDAKALAAKPLTALRDLRKRQIDAFINALGVRSTRQGIFVVRQPGTLARLAKASDRETALAAAGAGGGRLTLTIDSRTTDGTSIAATLASADKPELKKKFAGRLQLDLSGNRVLLNLRATQPPPNKPPAEGDLKRVIHWSALLLELRGNNLLGIATAGPPEAQTVMNVVFTGPQAAPAPAAPKPPAKPAK